MPVFQEPQFVDIAAQHARAEELVAPERAIRTIQSSGARPFLLEGDFLKVTNRDNVTHDFPWALKHYVIEPGQSKFVPLEALVDSMGDPRSMDNEAQPYNDGNGNKGVVMSRQFELDRLFGRYAIVTLLVDDLVDKTPRIEVETLNGDPVSFPATHPDMLPMPLHNVDDKNVRSDLSKSLDKLESENQEMREALVAMNDKLDQMVREREGLTD